MKIHLEFTEGLAGVAENIHIRYGIEGYGRNIVGHTPEVAAIGNIGLPVRGMMEMQGQLAGLLGTDMLRNLVNVVHQSHRVAECVGIDILHQEGLGISIGKLKIYFISTVNVAHLDGIITEVFIFNPEESADFQQFLMKIHTCLLSVFSEK
jgi:hypothetical protein